MIHVPLLRAQIDQVGQKGSQLLSSFLYCFSLLYFWPSMASEIGKYEHFVFLYLALVCRTFRFCCGDSNFLEYYESYRLLLENLKVMFPFYLLTQLPYV